MRTFQTFTGQGAGAGKDGAVSLTCSPGRDFKLLNITAHAASSVTDPLVVTLDSGDGSAYDTVLSSDGTWTNLEKVGEEGEIFMGSDSIVVTCVDAVVVKSVIVRVELL